MKTAWAIAYTRRNGKPRSEPYVFLDTIRSRRKDAWVAFREGGPAYSGALKGEIYRRHGPKAIKVRVEVVA